VNERPRQRCEVVTTPRGVPRAILPFAIVVLAGACTVRVGEEAAKERHEAEDCAPSSVRTSELSPRYTVNVDNGTARATAEIDSTSFSNNYALNGCEALLFNGRAMARTSDALIVFDQSYAATIVAPTAGSFRFELRRSAGEVLVSEIPVVTIALSEPKPSAVLRSEERVRVAWSPAVGDEDVRVVMTVLSGRQFGGQITATAKRREGGATMDGFSWPVMEGESIAVRVAALVSLENDIERPFAGGHIRVAASASVDVTLSPR
jgi:hypothetical protein